MKVNSVIPNDATCASNFYLVYKQYLELLPTMAAIKSQVQQSKYMLCNEICFDLKGEDQCQSA